jgi:hypothetical protein
MKNISASTVYLIEELIWQSLADEFSRFQRKFDDVIDSRLTFTTINSETSEIDVEHTLWFQYWNNEGDFGIDFDTHTIYSCAYFIDEKFQHCAIHNAHTMVIRDSFYGETHYYRDGDHEESITIESERFYAMEHSTVDGELSVNFIEYNPDQYEFAP